MAVKKNVLALCAFAAACAISLSGTLAATTPFTWASVEIDSLPAGMTGGGYLAQTNTTPPTVATESNSLSGSWGSASGFASADLTTGQLKVDAAASNPIGGSTPYVNVNAYFGDSFTTSTASKQPFTWSPSSAATFAMTLDGSLSPSNNLADENASAFILLMLYNKGTLDPSGTLLGSNLIGAPYLWTIGNPNIQLFYTAKDGTSTPLTATSNFDSIPSSITQAITPGADFDWVVLIGAGGQPGSNQSFEVNMTHTLSLSYQGPAGTTTTSASGLFESFVTPVPEPQSLALLLSGFGAAVVRRRGAANRSHGRA